MTEHSRTDTAVERAYSILEVKELKDGERVIKGTATTPRPDRVGDIVEPLGVSFKNPLPLLHQHDHQAPVGTVVFDKPTKNGITFTAKLARIDEPGPLRDRIETAWGELKAGLVRAVSIGFRNLEHAVMENGGWRFIQTEVLELSLVTVPANADCTISSIKSIDRHLRAASGTSHRRTDKTARVWASRKERSVTGDTQMTNSERISALEAEETNLVKQLSKFDVDNMDEADDERFEDIEAELAAVRKKLKRLKTIETISASGATVVDKSLKSGAAAANARNGGDKRTTVLGPNSNIPAGIPFARSVMCLAAAGGNHYLASQIAKQQYQDDGRIALYLQAKAAVPGAYVGDGGGWAEDIAEAQTIGSQFIEFLRPMTIIDRLSGFRRVPFNTKVPRLATGQSGYWVGEAKPAPLTSGVFDTVTMGYTKVGSISVLTKEQIRFSNIAAETTIRDDLAAGVVGKMDSTFIGTAAASAGVSPAGLLNGVSAQASAGDTADDVRTDIANLYKLLSAANIDLDGVAFVTTGRLKKAIGLMRSSLGIAEFPGDTLDGQPFIGSNHVGGGDLIAISTRDILLADDGNVDIEMSDQASLEMLDGSLEQDLTSGTGSPTAGMVSMFQTGGVAIKVSRFINWQKARSAAVQFVGDATYLGVATA